jgi:hypothetical protein
MSNLIEVTLDENSKIYLEVSQESIKKSDGQFVPVASSGEKVIQKAKDYLDDNLNKIKVFSSSIANSIKSLDFAPNELEVEFGVKFAADAGIIISSISSEANITIKLKWSKT